MADSLDRIARSAAWGTGLIKNPKVNRVLTVLAGAEMGLESVRRLRNYLENKAAYSISVPGDDAIFEPLHAWLLTNVRQGRVRSVTVRTRHGEDSAYPEGTVASANGDGDQRAHISRVYNGDRAQILRLEGHRIMVSIEKAEGSPARNESRDVWMARRERIIFTAYSQPAYAAVNRLIQKITEDRYGIDRSPAFYVADRWGNHYTKRSDLPPRTFDTIVLPDGQARALIGDVENFLESEAKWSAMGQPWHRGYLFHGPPGTGKTSLGRALAHHFGFDVYYISLSNRELNDTDLMSLVGRVPARSVLLLEDIDIFHAATDRSDDQQGMTLSGLLNSIDGISTPHGLITIMTTNDRTALDAALIRPGRVDFEMEVGYIDWVGMLRLGEIAFGEAGAMTYRNELGHLRHTARYRQEVTPAAVVEVLKRHLDDPLKAAQAVHRLTLPAPPR